MLNYYILSKQEEDYCNKNQYSGFSFQANVIFKSGTESVFL